MERSGAGLTWDYLNPGVPRPRIIDLIEDRDLWRFKHDPETRQFHAALMSHDWDNLTTPCYGFISVLQMLDCWHEWATEAEYRKQNPAERIRGPSAAACSWYDILREGSAILRAQRQLIDGILRGARRTMKIAGHVVPVANVSSALASEAGNALCADPRYAELHLEKDSHKCWFSATYYDGADGRRHFSLRSPEGGADVGAIAKRMAGEFNLITKDHNWSYWRPEYRNAVWAGGGHEHAAGFDAPIGWEGE